jgi:hypothetical protein
MGLLSGIGNFIGSGLKKIGGIAKHIPGVGGIIGKGAELVGGLLNKPGLKKVGSMIDPALGALSGLQGVESSRQRDAHMREALRRYNTNYDQGRDLLMQEPRVSLDHLFATKAPPVGGVQAGLTRVKRTV